MKADRFTEDTLCETECNAQMAMKSDLPERTFEFAKRIVKLCHVLDVGERRVARKGLD